MQANEQSDNLMSMNPPDNNSSIAKPSELANPGSISSAKSSAESRGNRQTKGGLRTPNGSAAVAADPIRHVEGA